jgi:hypothetical protein
VEILAISVVLNIILLRRGWQSKVGHAANILTPLVASITAKAKVIKDMYRQIVAGAFPVF